MQQYEKYKDSGIKWLGEIPEHWDICKNKYVNKVYNGDSLNEGQKTKYQSGNAQHLAYISSKDIDVNNSRIDYDNGLRISDYNSFKIAPKNSSLICIEGGSAGRKIGYLDRPVCFVNKLACIDTYNKKFSSKYVYYSLKCNIFQTQFFNSMTGLIGGVSISAINDFLLTFPLLYEQKAIAKFLDDKCEKIDAAVCLKEQQIERLKELREITINNAVTKGILASTGKVVSTKNSGIDWVGVIPRHWEAKANRTIFVERNENGDENLPLLSVSIHSGVSKEELDDDLNIRGRIKIEDKSSYKLVRTNDIVFNMMRAWQGAIGQVSNDGMVSPAYIVAKPIIPINSMFIEYLFRTRGYIESMNRASKGITDFRKRLYWDQFKALNTIVPPFPEQEQIVAYLDEQTSKIDKAIAQKQDQIIKLKEYKQSLINEVVTGKLKVVD